MKKKLNKEDFFNFLNSKFTSRFIDEINKKNLLYKELTSKKKKKLLNVIKYIVKKKNFFRSGYKYKKKWETGWSENLINYKKKFSEDSLIPGYSDKFNYARIDNRIVMCCSKNFDHKLLHLILFFCYEKFLKKYDNIVDFGCGTGHAILYLNKFNSKKKFFGLDWSKSSQEILKEVNNKHPNIFGANFDFFKPYFSMNLKKNKWAAYTTASMEQIGSKFQKFYIYLKKKKPGIIVNIEPIPEILDKKNILENLSIQYMYKRNYLNGYLKFLKYKEKKNEIKIIFVRKSYFGSFLINGYSIIVWKFC
jgi:hypothetical protein